MQPIRPPPAFNRTIIAHRGASAEAPENTLAALQRAHEQGAGWAEIDVKLSHDGFPVLMHDDTLDRTTNGRGPVAACDLKSLSALDAGSWKDPHFAGERIPRLEDILAFAVTNGLALNLEIKPCPGRAAETARVTCETVQRCWPAGAPPMLLSSFERICVQVAADMLPAMPRGLIAEGWPPDWPGIARKLGLTALVLNKESITAEAVEAVHKISAALVVYTVNDIQKARDLLGLGADALVTNHPAELLALSR